MLYNSYGITAPIGTPPERGPRRLKLKRAHTTFYQDDEDALQASGELFSKLDVDNSSFLESFELKRTRDLMLGNSGCFDDRHVAISELLSGIDLDNDGRVDTGEWNEFMRSLYEIAGRSRFLEFIESIGESLNTSSQQQTTSTAVDAAMQSKSLVAVSLPFAQDGRKSDLSLLGKSSGIDRGRMYKQADQSSHIERSLSARSHTSEHPAVSSIGPVKPVEGRRTSAGKDKIVRRRPSPRGESGKPSPFLQDTLPTLQPTRSLDVLASKEHGSLSQTRVVQSKQSKDPLAVALEKLALKHNTTAAHILPSIQNATCTDNLITHETKPHSAIDVLPGECNTSMLKGGSTRSDSETDFPAKGNSVNISSLQNPQSDMQKITLKQFLRDQVDSSICQAKQSSLNVSSVTSNVSKSGEKHLETNSLQKNSMSDIEAKTVNVVKEQRDLAPTQRENCTTQVESKKVSAHLKSSVPIIRVENPSDCVNSAVVDHRVTDTTHMEGHQQQGRLPIKQGSSASMDTEGSILDLHTTSDDALLAKPRSRAQSLLVPVAPEVWPQDLVDRGRSNSFDVGRRSIFRSKSPTMPCITETSSIRRSKSINNNPGKTTHRKDSDKAPEEEPEPEAPIGEPRRPSRRSARKNAGDEAFRAQPTLQATKSSHDEKWLQRHLEKEMHLLTADEVWEIMTHWHGGTTAHVDLANILEVFMIARRTGLDMSLVDLVPQHNFEHWEQPEDLSPDEFLHLVTILENTEDLSSLTEEFVREQMAPVRALCRTPQMQETVMERVEDNAVLYVRQWRQLINFLSLLMRIDVEYILAHFVWVMIGHFEMTDILAAKMMLACSSKPPKPPQNWEEEIIRHAIDLDILYERGFAHADIVRLCTHCGVLDPHGKKGISMSKVSQIDTDCCSRMQELIANRSDAYKRKKGRTSLLHHRHSSHDVSHTSGHNTPRSHGHKDSHSYTGRTEFSILVESLFRALPKIDRCASPLQFCLRLLMLTADI